MLALQHQPNYLLYPKFGHQVAARPDRTEQLPLQDSLLLLEQALFLLQARQCFPMLPLQLLQSAVLAFFGRKGGQIIPSANPPLVHILQ